MNDAGQGSPSAFRQAVAAVAAARPRPEVSLAVLPSPRRLAPFAHAVEGAVTVDGEELADGRFVLLHDPEGQEAWHGDFRLVTLARAELEPELGSDPLLPEVAWTWLTDALDGRALGRRELSGTVTRAGSYFFGTMDDRASRTEVELRASWTPQEPAEAHEHLLAWCELLAQCAGLAPESASLGVAVFPHRRGPRPA